MMGAHGCNHQGDEEGRVNSCKAGEALLQRRIKSVSRATEKVENKVIIKQNINLVAPAVVRNKKQVSASRRPRPRLVRTELY